MVCTTTLANWEIDVPTGDVDIDEALDEARKLTGKDLQVVVTKNEDRRVFARNRVWDSWQLYVKVEGIFPWQVMMCANSRETIFSYLCGMVNGCHGCRSLLSRQEID